MMKPFNKIVFCIFLPFASISNIDSCIQDFLQIYFKYDEIKNKIHQPINIEFPEIIS